MTSRILVGPGRRAVAVAHRVTVLFRDDRNSTDRDDLGHGVFGPPVAPVPRFGLRASQQGQADAVHRGGGETAADHGEVSRSRIADGFGVVARIAFWM